jgi:hypothetical protein
VRGGGCFSTKTKKDSGGGALASIWAPSELESCLFLTGWGIVFIRVRDEDVLSWYRIKSFLRFFLWVIQCSFSSRPLSFYPFFFFGSSTPFFL